jgi:carbamoyltransferase
MKKTFAIFGIKDRFQSDYPGYVHEHNLCLMQDGRIVHYLQLERYTRRKYDNRLDVYIEELVDKGLLNLSDEFDIVSVNSFVGNSFISKTGRLRIDVIPFQKIDGESQKAYAWFEENQFRGKEINAFSVSHELAHVFSNLPFHGMFNENSLLVHFDGGASLSNFSTFTFRNNRVESVEAHWELSHLSKFFNDNALNFAILGADHKEHTSVPGKLMGFASYGNYSEEIEKWLVRNEYFRDIWNDHRYFFLKVKDDFGMEIHDFDTHHTFLQDIAATFQTMFQMQTLAKLREMQFKTQTEYLYYAGGSALNIVTNTHIIESGIFKDVFIPPACNDSGLSIGAAAYVEWKKGNTILKHKPYLNDVACDFESCERYDKELIARTSELLLQKRIIGVANGYGEAGPRALGNRSILALADSKELSVQVSTVCKQREWYRPIAPVMLKEVAEKVTGKAMHHLSKYMLLDYKILPKYRKQLEGVVHINGSARIQTIGEREENPFIFDLLTYIWEKHHILGLINTSFNAKGEPIVHTKKDALNSAKNMGLDAVIIDYELIPLQNEL